MYMGKLMTSAEREGQGTLKYIKEAWAEGAQDAEEPLRWDAGDIVYMAALPWSRKKYVGETKNGLEIRLQQHSRDGQGTRNKKEQRVHAEVRRLGAHRFVWFPIACWTGRRGQVTEAMRTMIEAEHIYVLQPELNTEGRSSVRTLELETGELLVASKKRRYRPLKKFLMKERGGGKEQRREEPNYVVSEKVAADKMERRFLFGLAVRLGRRPLRVAEAGARGPAHRTIKFVQGMDGKSLTKLIFVIQGTLDRTSRSTALANLRKMKTDGKLVQVAVSLKSSMLWLPGMKKQILNHLKHEAARWKGCGVTVLIRARLTTAAARSTQDLMENTQKWSEKERHEFK